MKNRRRKGGTKFTEITLHSSKSEFKYILQKYNYRRKKNIDVLREKFNAYDRVSQAKYIPNTYREGICWLGSITLAHVSWGLYMENGKIWRAVATQQSTTQGKIEVCRREGESC